MSDFEFHVFVNYPSLIAYCKPYDNSCDASREVIDAIKEESGKIVVAKTSWKDISRAALNLQRLLKHLTDRATEYKRDNDLEGYVSEVLDYDALSDRTSVPHGLNQSLLPNIGDLENKVRDDGLADIREYADTHMRLSHSLYNALDRKIDLRLDDGNRIDWTTEAAINQFSENARSDLMYEDLTEAYVWCNGNSKNSIITRNSSYLYKNKGEFYDRIGTYSQDPELEVISAEEAIQRM